MKIIAVANQKGGVGKSTLAVHLAFHASEAGQRVLLVDLDAQGNSSSTMGNSSSTMRRGEVLVRASDLFDASPSFKTTAAPNIALASGDASLLDVDRLPFDRASHFIANLERISERYDLCVLDTAPAGGLRQVAALAAAGFVVSPIELEAYSIQGITAMLQTIFGVRQRYNASLAFVGMLPSRFNAHSPSQKAALADLLAAHPSLVVPHAIGLRTSIAEATAAGIPVWQLSKTSAREAAREMKAALAAIEARMTH